MKLAEVMAARKRAAEMFAQANIVLTQDELENIEVADFLSMNWKGLVCSW